MFVKIIYEYHEKKNYEVLSYLKYKHIILMFVKNKTI